MYGLTFENIGKPIAIISDTDEIVHIADYNQMKKRVPKKYEKQQNVNDYGKLFDGFKGRRKTEVKNNVHLLLTDPDAIDYIDDEPSLKIYREIKSERKLFQPTTEMKLDDGEYMIYCNPDKKQFESILIVGQSGSGKSTIALKYSYEYNYLFPDNEIYLISSLEKDATLDKNKRIVRIPIESFLQLEPTIDEFKNSLVIFDDWETLEYSNKPLYKKICSLLTQIVSKGRHENIRSIIIKHKFQSSADKCGQLVVSEATHYVVYPRTCSKANLKLLLCTHGVLDTKQLNAVLKMPTRWIAYCKSLPNYIITENQIMIL